MRYPRRGTWSADGEKWWNGPRWERGYPSPLSWTFSDGCAHGQSGVTSVTVHQVNTVANYLELHSRRRTCRATRQRGDRDRSPDAASFNCISGSRHERSVCVP